MLASWLAFELCGHMAMPHKCGDCEEQESARDRTIRHKHLDTKEL